MSLESRHVRRALERLALIRRRLGGTGAGMNSTEGSVVITSGDQVGLTMSTRATSDSHVAIVAFAVLLERVDTLWNTFIILILGSVDSGVDRDETSDVTADVMDVDGVE